MPHQRTQLRNLPSSDHPSSASPIHQAVQTAFDQSDRSIHPTQEDSVYESRFQQNFSRTPVHSTETTVIQKQSDSEGENPTLEDQDFLDASSELEPETPYALPIAGGAHHVLTEEVDGILRLGFASEFTQVEQIVRTLLATTSPLTPTQRTTVTDIYNDVTRAETEMNRLWHRYIRLNRTAHEARRTAARVGKGRTSGRNDPAYQKARETAKQAFRQYAQQQRDAINFAKDKILELWEIGKDFLPTNLMPVGEVFRDKSTFGGDTSQFSYHTGKPNDRIPITWYKAPGDYPRLKLSDNTIVKFGDTFTAAGISFGLSTDNAPKVDWKLQKTAHNETREGQKSFNDALTNAGVKVEKGGNFVTPPLGNTHQFDGDHVKDLGFGGQDIASNYWPLNSTINRRAFNGYNAGYVVHYLNEKGEHQSRAIGGLVGKHFVVKRFLSSNAAPVPNDGAAAGGTLKP